MKFSELPGTTRVKLSGKAEKEFWHRVDEFGGVKQLSRAFDYSSSKMYNWKSKSSFIPVEIVRTIFGNEASNQITAFKGPGRSKPVENPRFPLEENDELLTRVKCSVYVNRNGTPIYQTDDRGNVERFAELLELLGEVPFKVYSRKVYELHYPKHVHELLEQMSFEPDFAALIDEEGSIEDGYLVHEDRKMSVDDFNQELFSRGKKLQLALARGDSEQVAEIMGEEARRVNSLG